MEKLAGAVERIAVSALIALLMVTILFGTAVVAWSLVEDVLHTRELVAEPRVLIYQLSCSDRYGPCCEGLSAMLPRSA
jgi:hypothetical protein